MSRREHDNPQTGAANDWIPSASVHPDRPLLAYSSGLGALALVSLETGDDIWRITVRDLKRPPSGKEKGRALTAHGVFPAPDLGTVLLGPGDDGLYVGRRSGGIDVRSLDSGELAASSPEGHSAAVRCLAWSSASDVLLSGGEDGGVLVWDKRMTSNELVKLPGHYVLGIAAADTENVMAFVSARVHVWDLCRSRELCTFEVPFGNPDSLSLSADGQYLCVRDIWGNRAFYSAPDGRHLSNLPGFMMRLGVMTAARVFPSSNARYLAIAPGETRIEVWDCRSGNIVYERGETTMRPYPI